MYSFPNALNRDLRGLVSIMMPLADAGEAQVHTVRRQVRLIGALIPVLVTVGLASCSLFLVSGFKDVISGCTVTYNANGGNGSPPDDNRRYSEGAAVTVQGRGGLMRTGMVFTGWNTLANGSGLTYTPGQSFQMGKADLILYAVWVTGCGVVYSSPSGSTGVPVDTTVYLSSQTATVMGPGSMTRAGYLFLSWDTLPTGLGLTLNPGDSISPPATLYAMWAATIWTVAGTGVAGSAGDGGPALSAQLNHPNGIAFDSAGNIYVADYNSYEVRKIATDGTITTVAGNGTFGYSGDGLLATSAQLASPSGLAVDNASHCLYVSDFGNNTVRKVDLGTGIISTVAGNATAGYSGDNGPAISAQLQGPSGIALDSAGNLYIADYANNRIRMVSSGTITTVAGTGSAGFTADGVPATSAGISYPTDVAIDSANNIYVADNYAHRIRMFTVGGNISTVAGTGSAGSSGDGGPATSAQLHYPYCVAVDALGNLSIGDWYSYRIRRVVLATGMITTVAGNGTNGYLGDGGAATAAEISDVKGLAVDSTGAIYIVDTSSNRIRKVPAP
jgi:sugar lactone lactonase YvrE